uniref:glycogenin glucosyltransferase n=1 Tax=Pavo cristatus TaxID=9049 RepID=A0A8C9GAC1_PAVCR
VTDQAFVTLATDDVYCQGALVLGQSLRNHTTSRKLAVLITPEVSSGMRSVLRSVFDEVTEVDALDSADSVHLALLQRPELGVTFTKLHCWTLTHYSKCVFMDADTLVSRAGAVVMFVSVLDVFFSNWATADIGKHLPFIYNLSSSAVYTYVPAFNQYTFHKIKYYAISLIFDMDISVAEDIFILILNVRNYNVHQFKYGNILTTNKETSRFVATTVNLSSIMYFNRVFKDTCFFFKNTNFPC